MRPKNLYILFLAVFILCTDKPVERPQTTSSPPGMFDQNICSFLSSPLASGKLRLDTDASEDAIFAALGSPLSKSTAQLGKSEHNSNLSLTSYRFRGAELAVLEVDGGAKRVFNRFGFDPEILPPAQGIRSKSTPAQIQEIFGPVQIVDGTSESYICQAIINGPRVILHKNSRGIVRIDLIFIPD